MCPHDVSSEMNYVRPSRLFCLAYPSPCGLVQSARQGHHIAAAAQEARVPYMRTPQGAGAQPINQSLQQHYTPQGDACARRLSVRAPCGGRRPTYRETKTRERARLRALLVPRFAHRQLLEVCCKTTNASVRWCVTTHTSESVTAGAHTCTTTPESAATVQIVYIVPCYR